MLQSETEKPFLYVLYPQATNDFFESGSTSTDNTTTSTTINPVNENEEFCCIFRSRLGSHSIVYGAEMDGFRLKSSQDLRDLEFLDLNRYAMQSE